jgi:N-acetylmuramoyl-L-alanine amidase
VAVRKALVLCALLLVAASCGESNNPHNASRAAAAATTASTSTTTVPTTTTTVPPTTTTTAPPPTTTTSAPPSPPATVAATVPAPAGAGVVVIDPGHNGGNAQHVAEISRLVDIGVGKKACNTVGAETNAGYPEHAFNWDVSVRVAAVLRAAGITVVFTHPNDTGWGPCSVDRAAIANRAHALATVSIHADGGPPSGRGFHVIEPALLPGLTDDIYAASMRLGHDLHDAVESGTSMPPSTYVGNGDGYAVRSDLGGLDRADVPAVFIECANMRNATDAALITNPALREQLAEAIARGIRQFIGR